MIISILQTNIHWLNAEENEKEVKKLLHSSQKSHLYVLPEMWNSGFVMQPNGNINNNNQSLCFMRTMAHELNAAVCGTIATPIDNGKYVNRHFFVYPNGEYKYYDKRHLFTYGGENKCYKAGEERVIVKYEGVRFLLATCYDLRFPTWLRYKEDYDAIIIAANWPESRINAWKILLQARAIENQCYVIAANRVGEDHVSQYNGQSAIIDAKGNYLAQGGDKENSFSAEISIEKLNNFRDKFRVLKDRDK